MEAITTIPEALAAVSADGYALARVPHPLRTKEVCAAALSQIGRATRRTDKIGYAALPHHNLGAIANALKHIPETERTQENYITLVSENGKALAAIPYEERTSDICTAAVSQHSFALIFVPRHLRTKALLDIAENNFCFEGIDWYQEFVGDIHNIDDILELILQEHDYRLDFSQLKPHQITASMCETLVKHYPHYINLIPKESRSEKIRKISLWNPDWSKTTRLDTPLSAQIHPLHAPGNTKINWKLNSRLFSEATANRSSNNNPQWEQNSEFFAKKLPSTQAKTDNTDFYSSPDDHRIVKQQPEWEMTNPDDNWSPREQPREWPSRTHDARNRSNGNNWRMERIAYYVPANFQSHPGTQEPATRENYGIHIIRDAVADLSSRISTDVESANFNEAASFKLISATLCYKFFAHEMCHAWIEDLCCLVDHIQGLHSSRYLDTNHRYNSYIFMEEAICNSAAYGWINHLFRNASWVDSSIHSNNVLGAFYNSMISAPKGYRDFLPLRELPESNFLFKKNVIRLLNQVYRYPSVVRSLHGPEITLEQIVDMFFSGTRTSPTSFFSGIPPVFLH